MKILYVFNTGRHNRIKNFGATEFPKEMYYGYFFLKEKFEVDSIELDNSTYQVTDKLSKELFQLNAIQHNNLNIGNNAYILRNYLDKLNENDILIAIPDSSGLGLAKLKELGLLKPKIIFFAMGLASQLHAAKNRNWFKYRLFIKPTIKKHLKNIDKAIFLGEGEIKFMNAEFTEFKDKFKFIPFAVDVRFWNNESVLTKTEDFVLFVGNDAQRNFDLLIKIAKETPEVSYKFITSKLEQSQVPGNVELIVGDWKKNTNTDEDMRSFYQKAKFVILPLKDSIQPSGQSVTLQAMSSGKPVLISKTAGFWEIDKFKDRENIMFLNNDVNIWTEEVRELFKNSELYLNLCNNAFDTVKSEYNLNRFYKNLLDVINE